MGQPADHIREQITVALKAGDKVRLSTLRMLSAAVKNAEVELGHELAAAEVQEVAVREAKKRKESIEAFLGAGRQDLVDKEQAELAVLADWLPSQLSDDEIDAIIDEVIVAVGAAGPSDMGKVMGPVMGRMKGQADGRVVQDKVKARLSAAD